jgi:hypothetical protein
MEKIAMSKIGENPNDTLPPGKPLKPHEVAPADDDGLGPVNEDEDDTDELPSADIENQAGTEATDAGKFDREPAEGGDNDGS